MTLRPALTIRPQATLADFDRRHPDGADFVIVPALRRYDDPAMLAWINAQAAKGATIVGVCSGVLTVSKAGLLRDRAATGYWGDIDKLRAENPTMRWVRDRRYVADRGVVTTTGVTASVPVSLALVEAIAGRARADKLAREIGAAGWHSGHDTEAFRVAGPNPWMAALTTLTTTARTSFGIPVSDGVDDIALAFTADTYSRVYRTRAATIADGATVRTRDGLELAPDQPTAKADVDRLLARVPAEQPARALDAALADISDKYGRDTADKIAHQLEYPGDSFGR